MTGCTRRALLHEIASKERGSPCHCTHPIVVPWRLTEDLALRCCMIAVIRGTGITEAKRGLRFMKVVTLSL
jgi:hypothetical protein